MATAKKKPTAKQLQAQLKKEGYRLPHGYELEKRSPRKKKAASKTGAKKKATTNKGLAKLKKINAEAKKIQRHDPSLKWQSAVKLASKRVK